jgi:hypothetical protein
MKTIIAVAALAGISLVVPFNKKPSPKDYYWYHPERQACPAYQYDPDKPATEAEAKRECENTHGTCVKMQGTAAPACLR